MFFVTYAAALLAVLFLAAGTVLALSPKRGALTKALSWYCLSAAVWIGGNAVADVAYLEMALVLASGIAFIGGAANLFSFLVLVDALVDSKLPRMRRMLLYAFPTGTISLFAFSDLAISGVAFPMNAPAQIMPGPVYVLSLVLLLIGLGYGLARLGNGIRQAVSEERKKQLAYCFLGLLAMLAGELTFNVILPLMGEVRFYTLGAMSSIIFATSCGYAVLRYKLIRLELVIRTLERKVAARTRELQELQEEQRRMVIDLTHNLQTPLAVLKSRLERFKRTMLHDAEFRSLERSIEALSAYVHELTSLSVLEQELKLEILDHFSLSALVEEAVEEITVIADAGGVRIESRIEPDLLYTGNRKRLRESLMNVASNALKYGTRGEGSEVRVDLLRCEDAIELRVQDFGQGIPKDEIPHLFERTYRCKAHAYDTPSGSGLGLSMVKRVIEEHGGDILVETAPGEGAAFILRLPLQR